MNNKLPNAIFGIFCVILGLLIGMLVLMDRDEATEGEAEGSAVFDVDCSCGNNLYATPFDPNCFKFVCSECEKIYQNNWFDDWLDAIEWVESKGNSWAQGDKIYFESFEEAENWRESHGGIFAHSITVSLKAGDQPWDATRTDDPSLDIWIAKAVGAYQIHKIYVDEVNRILKGMQMPKRFTYEDRWDKAKSREMSLIHNEHWSGFALLVCPDMSREEAFIRSHQGAFGWKTESTKPYWEKVKARMESVK